MRLDDERESDNVEDRRGFGLSPGVFRVGGLGGIAIIVLGLLFGIDPRLLLQLASDRAPQQAEVTQDARHGGQDDPQRRFVAQVLGSTEDVWRANFTRMGREYEAPKLILFSGAVQSACGMAQSATGPFYCPADRRVYLDLSFFRDLQGRLGAAGDFPRAYVIAHEVGHHVQTLLGITRRANQMRAQADESQSRQISVRIELQADCLAGVWANRANQSRRILEEGDVEEGLNAASAIGDDRLQRRARGYAVPESFTHGSSAQRVRWFRRGLEGGDVRSCDTFGATQL